MTTIEIDQFQPMLAHLIEEIGSDGVFLITKDSKPIAEIKPVLPQKEFGLPKFGCAAGLIQMSADFDEPLEEFKPYME